MHRKRRRGRNERQREEGKIHEKQSGGKLKNFEASGDEDA